MRKLLDKKFFLRPTLIVAKELLGKYLVLEKNGKRIEALITEVEAYDGFEDKASHASRGQTPRNKIMFEEGGRWYIYFCYGMHHMLNVTTGERDYPAAVLIRAIDKAKGPGRVTKYFGIDKCYNEKPASKKTGLYIEDRGVKIDPKKIRKTARTGVDYAGLVWAKKEYKFFVG